MKNAKGLALGVLVLLALILGMIGISKILQKNTSTTTIYGAVGGGKENLLEDEEFLKTLKKYKINVVNDSWSNGKLVVNDVVRKNGDSTILYFSQIKDFMTIIKHLQQVRKQTDILLKKEV